MKKVTISLPDEVYRRARVRAAESDKSLSAFVRELLEGAGAEESEFQRRRRLQHEVLSTIRRFRASDRLTRDETHRRRAVR